MTILSQKRYQRSVLPPLAAANAKGSIQKPNQGVKTGKATLLQLRAFCFCRLTQHSQQKVQKPKVAIMMIRMSKMVRMRAMKREMPRERPPQHSPAKKRHQGRRPK